jgi:ABC-type Fe3+/spermidine/putrescine transport system ATPase subunit
MSALDARLRTTLQHELREVHRRLGTTFILVTHDQAEAMSVADRVIVMHRGRIERDGSPREVYDRPGTPFVADFVGGACVLEILERVHGGVKTSVGTLACASLDPSCTHVCVRPEDVRLAPSSAGQGLEVLDVVFRGDLSEVTLGPVAVRANVRPGEEPAVGSRVTIEVPPDRVRGLHG